MSITPPAKSTESTAYELQQWTEQNLETKAISETSKDFFPFVIFILNVEIFRLNGKVANIFLFLIFVLFFMYRRSKFLFLYKEAGRSLALFLETTAGLKSRTEKL